jgi:hypothetical protein
MWFHTDVIVQNYVSIIYNEGRVDELIKICDFYHLKFSDMDTAMGCMINFGEYIGKFYYGDKLWRFYYPDNEGSLYFIGSLEEVKKKVGEIL